MKHVQAMFENGNTAVVSLDPGIDAVGDTEETDPNKVWKALTKAMERDPKIVGLTKLKAGNIAYYADYTFMASIFPGPSRVKGTWSSESI